MIDKYIKYLKTFLSADYKFKFFDELDITKDKQIILRHDIDLDCKLALEMAQLESYFDVKSTYFFLLSNDSYNLLSNTNLDIVNPIKSFGHKISLHYDPTIYIDKQKSLEQEIKIFEEILNIKVDIISLHRPSPEYLESDKQIKYFNFPNTYQQLYFKDIKYFADSRGSFRYGDPLDSIEFKNKKNIQLLIHPFWWVVDSKNKKECVDIVYNKKCLQMKNHFINSIGFYNG